MAKRPETLNMNMLDIVRSLRALVSLGIILALTLSSLPSAHAGVLDNFVNSQGLPGMPGLPGMNLNQPREKVAPPVVKDPTLEDLFPHNEIGVPAVQNYSLKDMKIPGLTDVSVKQLGNILFVVVTNSPYRTFAEVYRDNRLHGKPNFVTADSIVHPYLAFTNGVAASVVASIAPELQALLTAMFNASAGQYKDAQDAEIRADAQANCAFLTVALKLLNPALPVAAVGEAGSLARAELANLNAGKPAKSAILNRVVDFSLYSPFGWYAASPQFANFYRCHEWLSRATFTLSDPAGGDDSVSLSEFKRSVLLFQSLQQSSIKGQPGLAVWQHVIGALDIIGTTAARDRMLLPSEYNTVLGNGQRISLNGLSEPLYRTKLLLSVRRQRPLEVGSASIFNPAEQKISVDNTVTFRLFPPTDDLELDWLRAQAHHYTAEGADGPDTPLALFDLYAHGAAQASNVLLESLVHLDAGLLKTLPPLVRDLNPSKPPSLPKYSLGRARWEIYSLYFKPYPEGAQDALRTSYYLSRQIESAFAAWVDGNLSVAPLAASPPGAQDDAQIPTAAAQAPTAAVPGGSDPSAQSPPVEPAKFNYLEPCPDLYKRIAVDAVELPQRLAAINCLPPDAKGKFEAFAKLTQRLATIAQLELSYKPIMPLDMGLLANIDKNLEKISYPIQGTLYLNDGDPAAGGCNLGLGRVGYLHLLCHTTKGMMLCRGPVYTYYEVPGKPIKPEHWQRKIEYSLLKPPEWAFDYDLVQNAGPVTTVVIPASGKSITVGSPSPSVGSKSASVAGAAAGNKTPPTILTPRNGASNSSAKTGGASSNATGVNASTGTNAATTANPATDSSRPARAKAPVAGAAPNSGVGVTSPTKSGSCQPPSPGGSAPANLTQ